MAPLPLATRSLLYADALAATLGEQPDLAADIFHRFLRPNWHAFGPRRPLPPAEADTICYWSSVHLPPRGPGGVPPTGLLHYVAHNAKRRVHYVSPLPASAAMRALTSALEGRLNESQLGQMATRVDGASGALYVFLDDQVAEWTGEEFRPITNLGPLAAVPFKDVHAGALFALGPHALHVRAISSNSAPTEHVLRGAPLHQLVALSQTELVSARKQAAAVGSLATQCVVLLRLGQPDQATPLRPVDVYPFEADDLQLRACPGRLVLVLTTSALGNSQLPNSEVHVLDIDERALRWSLSLSGEYAGVAAVDHHWNLVLVNSAFQRAKRLLIAPCFDGEPD